jgi:phytoene dehydrogenase-like protein
VGEAIDAVVVGSGPNGLAAAIVLAAAGCRVVVFERQPSIGGSVRSAELTLPGFTHDVCSAIHPFAVASPFLRDLPLDRYGLEWVEPAAMLAHPFDDGTAAIAYRSVDRTAATLGADGAAYRALMQPIVRDWSHLAASILAPPRWPRHPLQMMRFGLQAFQSADRLARRRFVGEAARALFAGSAAHGMLPLDKTLTAGFGLTLSALCHTVGWVLPRGGAQRISNALAAHLRALGGEIHTSSPVASIDDLPRARAILCDLSPRPFLAIAGHRLPAAYRRRLSRYRYGLGVYKMDFALDGPLPWRNRDCALAATVHLGGGLDEIARSECDAWEGRPSERPLVLLAQPSLFDPLRAPAGKHTVWAYCHVPHASTVDMSARIEAQIERFAPGFSERVIGRHALSPADLEAGNPNLVGGDIAGGVTDIWQLFARPTLGAYSTPVRGLYLCSASTPPGVGVHGMCGYFAARRALHEVLRG